MAHNDNNNATIKNVMLIYLFTFSTVTVSLLIFSTALHSCIPGTASELASELTHGQALAIILHSACCRNKTYSWSLHSWYRWDVSRNILKCQGPRTHEVVFQMPQPTEYLPLSPLFHFFFFFFKVHSSKYSLCLCCTILVCGLKTVFLWHVKASASLLPPCSWALYHGRGAKLLQCPHQTKLSLYLFGR